MDTITAHIIVTTNIMLETVNVTMTYTFGSCNAFVVLLFVARHTSDLCQVCGVAHFVPRSVFYLPFTCLKRLVRVPLGLHVI